MVDFKVTAPLLVNAVVRDSGNATNRLRLENELLEFCEEWADPHIGAGKVKAHLSKILHDIEAHDETQ